MIAKTIRAAAGSSPHSGYMPVLGMCAAIVGMLIAAAGTAVAMMAM